MLVNDEVDVILPTLSRGMPRPSNLAEMLQQMYGGDRVKSEEEPEALLLTNMELSL